MELVVKPVIKKLLNLSRHFSESVCILKLFKKLLAACQKDP